MIDLNVDMTCGHCVIAVTRAVEWLDPDAIVQVDFENKQVHVDGRSSVSELTKALAAAGYAAAPTGRPAPQSRQEGRLPLQSRYVDASGHRSPGRRPQPDGLNRLFNH